jgi:hypothetical protein
LRLTASHLAALGCVRVEAGILDASQSVTSTRPWVAAGGLVLGRWAFAPPFFLQLGLGGVAPFVRDRYWSGSTVLYAVPAVDALASLTVGGAFGDRFARFVP